jgi:hypothetical protein
MKTLIVLLATIAYVIAQSTITLHGASHMGVMALGGYPDFVQANQYRISAPSNLVFGCYLGFDFSALPSYAVIESAKLKIKSAVEGSGTVTVYASLAQPPREANENYSGEFYQWTSAASQVGTVSVSTASTSTLDVKDSLKMSITAAHPQYVVYFAAKSGDTKINSFSGDAESVVIEVTFTSASTTSTTNSVSSTFI